MSSFGGDTEGKIWECPRTACVYTTYRFRLTVDLYSWGSLPKQRNRCAPALSWRSAEMVDARVGCQQDVGILPLHTSYHSPLTHTIALCRLESQGYSVE